MTEILCAAIAAAATIICACLAAQSSKRDKLTAAQQQREEDRAAQRAKEGRLQLAMISANSQLTIGLAMAMKHGHCNGEVEAGLKAVKAAEAEYVKFLEGIGIDHLTR